MGAEGAMIELVERHLPELRALSRLHQVKKLELFGSAAGGAFDPDRSDLDFLIEFLPMEPKEHAQAYFAVLFGLENLFHRKIDLLEAQAVTNPYFLRSVNQERQVLYAA